MGLANGLNRAEGSIAKLPCCCWHQNAIIIRTDATNTCRPSTRSPLQSYTNLDTVTAPVLSLLLLSYSVILQAAACWVPVEKTHGLLHWLQAANLNVARSSKHGEVQCKAQQSCGGAAHFFANLPPSIDSAADTTWNKKEKRVRHRIVYKDDLAEQSTSVGLS